MLQTCNAMPKEYQFKQFTDNIGMYGITLMSSLMRVCTKKYLIRFHFVAKLENVPQVHSSNEDLPTGEI